MQQNQMQQNKTKHTHTKTTQNPSNPPYELCIWQHFCLSRYNYFYLVSLSHCLWPSLYFLEISYKRWAEKCTENTFSILANTSLLKLRGRGSPHGPLSAWVFYSAVAQEMLCKCPLQARFWLSSNCLLRSFSGCSFCHALQNSWQFWCLI